MQLLIVGACFSYSIWLVGRVADICENVCEVWMMYRCSYLSARLDDCRQLFWFEVWGTVVIACTYHCWQSAGSLFDCGVRVDSFYKEDSSWLLGGRIILVRVYSCFTLFRHFFKAQVIMMKVMIVSRRVEAIGVIIGSKVFFKDSPICCSKRLKPA